MPLQERQKRNITIAILCDDAIIKGKNTLFLSFGNDKFVPG